jgi:HSP20 family molecular chaperone IbpA
MSEQKRVLIPMVNVEHNYDDTGFEIKVDIAGASKESVDGDMGNTGFCVKAEGDDFRYESCFMLGHEVKPADAEGRFDSGLLRVSVPFRDTTRGTKVPVV